MPANVRIEEYLTRHRFLVTEPSRVALDVFRQKLEEFMKLHPEIVGATIFGSHTKGMARTADHEWGVSDVDTFIFVEDAKYHMLPDTNIIDRVNYAPSNRTVKLINSSLKVPFQELFAQVAGYPQSQMKDIRFLPVSKQRIDNDIQFLKDMADGGVEGDQEWTAIASLFHLQLGNGLDPYRAYVLQELLKYSWFADEIWNSQFYANGLAMENYKIFNEDTPRSRAYIAARSILFPHTIKDAIKYFHLEGVKPKYEEANKPTQHLSYLML